MFHIIDERFFVPLASPNKLVYWECICKLFSVMDNQLSFGVDRDVVVEELQYYFEQTQAADFDEEEFQGKNARIRNAEKNRFTVFFLFGFFIIVPPSIKII